MEIKEVSFNSKIYQQGVQLRRLLFFKELENWQALIQDAYEKDSIHMVAVENDIVIGTGRITFEDTHAIISQMTVHPKVQKTGVGSKILQALMAIVQQHKVPIIKLSARKTAISFYKKHHFQTVGETYPSTKTGVIHQQMILEN